MKMTSVKPANPKPVSVMPPPPTNASPHAQADALLRQLGAVDAAGRPTARGQAMATLPVHPRLAAMGRAGIDRGAGWTAAVLAALLEERDIVRGRPEERPADLVSGLVLLILRQVMPIAARLAGGVALASHGVMGAAASRGLSAMRSGGSYAGRSMLDRAAIGYEGWRSGSTGSARALATAAPGKVTPVWRSAGRGG